MKNPFKRSRQTFKKRT